MAVSLYITHPQVLIDPDLAVPLWGLSETGSKRAEAFAAADRLPPDAIFVSSGETKARQCAAIFAQRHANTIVVRPDCGENDRSSTGFLPPDLFEQHADKMFAYPDMSANGWETANDAQARIVGAVSASLNEFGTGHPVVFVGHGCVGTLLKCHVGGRPIARAEDQGNFGDPGGGNIFAFDLAAGQLMCDWTAMEHWRGI